MRLTEFTDKETLPFDPVEDVVFFMRNNPQFYRKEVYPCGCEAKAAKKNGTFESPQSYFGNCVEKGMNEYKNKYDMHDVFKPDDKQKIIDLLFNEEMY